MRTDALLLVNLQNDFFAGGACPIPEAEAIIPKINWLIKPQAKSVGEWGLIVAVRDWRPRDSGHFAKYGGPASSPYCVAATDGAEFHPDIELPKSALIISKGTKVGERKTLQDQADPEIDGFSAFDGTAKGKRLEEIFRAQKIRRLFVAGMPVESSISSTVDNGIRLGFEMFVEISGCIGFAKKSSWKVFFELEKKGARLEIFHDYRTS